MAKPSKTAGIESVFTAAFDPLVKVVETLSEKIAGAFTRPLEGLNSSIQRPLLDVVGNMKSAALSAFLPLSAGLATFAAASGDTIQQLKSFVAKANPGAVFQFDRALDDLAGTLGQILTPVLNGVTGFVREMADVFQGLRPALAPIMGGIQQVIGLLGKLIEPLGKLLVPVFGVMGAVITNVVVPAIELLVTALEFMANVLLDVARVLTLGLIDLDYARQSSQGAAVRPASYGQGSKGILDIGQRTTLRALEAGRTPELTPDGKKITEKQDKTNELLGNIDKKLGGPGQNKEAAAPKQKPLGSRDASTIFAAWLVKQFTDDR